MDLQDLLVTAKEQSTDKFELKLNNFLREHYCYKNLDEANKKVVLDLIKKYLPKIRYGSGISSLAVKEEMHKLYEHRILFNLTEEDLKDIRVILEVFKK